MSGRGNTRRKLNLGPLSFTSKAPKQLTPKLLSTLIRENPALNRIAKSSPEMALQLARQQAIKQGNINKAVERFEKAGANGLAESMRKGPNSETILRMFGQAPSETTAAQYTFLHNPNYSAAKIGYNSNNLSGIISGYPSKKGGKRFRKTRRHSKSRRS